ncbi:4-hydroxythreonine-4-phosphate dehydrogenase PdxA [Halobacteria archaeon AArc-m2/3/4]|uniref:4-hydroxythreonine-4-phosphate dehydrogenase PdxA n=1 Tax=Natronoglomus mannanivorans TaxID=2979990 RepID=A0AAP2YUZ6_9EURY|nr:4-hydroxythreonine-4-phosphate dehydrogenase PdxA [Halobacteria archaeon AArc-xg1-1]MCU4973043.1 4-hydroxythreonine-4-phosphate dehydrogenase PdxA [Halobacteria archaeon AArc-m2/3/4]
MDVDTHTVAITMGDPAGIGAEIIAKGYPKLLADDRVRPVVIGDAAVLRAAIENCGLAGERRVVAVDSVDEAVTDADAIPVLDLANVDPESLEYGVVREAYGQASLEYVERAIELAREGSIDAITTAPINKQATKRAGSEYAGHTGMLADYTGTESYSMMLIEGDLRVTHVSTHVPLREACDLVTTDSVLETIRVTDDALVELGVDEPTIGVAGLNPHASDGGVLGETEAREIEPAVVAAREEGIDARGPESPDTVYVAAARGAYDCVVSMYHDQGHIPIKMLGFSGGGDGSEGDGDGENGESNTNADATVSGVNVTVGLPILRTSVDHGTAFDIAGEGIASERSLLQAVSVATDMAARRGAR